MTVAWHTKMKALQTQLRACLTVAAKFRTAAAAVAALRPTPSPPVHTDQPPPSPSRESASEPVLASSSPASEGLDIDLLASLDQLRISITAPPSTSTSSAVGASTPTGTSPSPFNVESKERSSASRSRSDSHVDSHERDTREVKEASKERDKDKKETERERKDRLKKESERDEERVSFLTTPPLTSLVFDPALLLFVPHTPPLRLFAAWLGEPSSFLAHALFSPDYRLKFNQHTEAALHSALASQHTSATPPPAPTPSSPATPIPIPADDTAKSETSSTSSHSPRNDVDLPPSSSPSLSSTVHPRVQEGSSDRLDVVRRHQHTRVDSSATLLVSRPWMNDSSAPSDDVTISPLASPDPPSLDDLMQVKESSGQPLTVDALMSEFQVPAHAADTPLPPAPQSEFSQEFSIAQLLNPNKASGIAFALTLPSLIVVSVCIRSSMSYESKATATVECHFPTHFHHLRSLRGISDEEFAESLARCSHYNALGGKASSFVRTHDNRYILKKVKKIEMDSLVENGPLYFDYLSKVIFPFASPPLSVSRCSPCKCRQP